MAMPTRAGRYKAVVVSGGMSESGKNNIPTVTLKLDLVQEWRNNAWEPCQDLQITYWGRLQKNDGSLMKRTLENLMETFGWNGRDFEFFYDAVNGLGCQCTLENNTYEGKTTLRVEWINPENSSGGGAKTLPKSELSKLNDKLSAKLRAATAGTAIPPKPASPKPSSPPPAPKAQCSPSTENDCWAAFVKHNEALAGESLQEAWFQYIKIQTGKDDPQGVTPQEWGRILNLIDEIPF